MKTLFSLLALALLAAPASAAQEPLPLAKLCDLADVVVVGEVASVQSHWAPGARAAIERHAWVVVEGSAGGVEVHAPGGTVDGLSHHVEHAAELAIDARYLLFLRSAGDHWIVVGGEQGAHAVHGDLDPAEVCHAN